MRGYREYAVLSVTHMSCCQSPECLLQCAVADVTGVMFRQ